MAIYIEHTLHRLGSPFGRTAVDGNFCIHNFYVEKEVVKEILGTGDSRQDGTRPVPHQLVNILKANTDHAFSWGCEGPQSSWCCNRHAIRWMRQLVIGKHGSKHIGTGVSANEKSVSVDVALLALCICKCFRLIATP